MVMKAFVDTDVIFDFLLRREPFATDAALLFNAGRQGRVQLHVSALCISNIYYLLRKHIGHEETLEKLRLLLRMCDVVEVNGRVILDALESKFKDFEDGIQYHSAVNAGGMDVIVTRNGKDFSTSKIPVMNASGLLQALRSKEGK